jgi:sugar phosphate isomerase/epimerase
MEGSEYMKVSMDYYTFLSRDKWDVWWYLNECDEMNLDGAHIPDCDVTYPHEIFTMYRPRGEWKYKPLPEEIVLKIRAFCDERNWEKVLSGWGGPYASDRTEDCLYLTKANLETASILGAKVMRIVPSGYRDDPRRFKIEWAVRNLKKASELAESYDIVMGLETHPVISCGSDIIEIIDRVDSDYLGVTLDTGNVTTSSDEDPNLPLLTAIETLAPKIVATHIRDVTYDRTAREWRCVPCGEGVVDFQAIARMLKDADYEGTLALEFISNNQNRAKEDLNKVKPIIQNCVEYLRKL